MTHVELQAERSNAMEGAGGEDSNNDDDDADMMTDPDMIRLQNIMQVDGKKDLLLPLCVTV